MCELVGAGGGGRRCVDHAGSRGGVRRAGREAGEGADSAAARVETSDQRRVGRPTPATVGDWVALFTGDESTAIDEGRVAAPGVQSTK